MRSALTRQLFAGIFLLSPLSALAEGAVRVLECTIEQTCDLAASCNPDSGDISFNMEPIKLAADGAGSYLIRYEFSGSTFQADMEARSFAGPFMWDIYEDRNTLLANSEYRFLWHKLSLSPVPQSDIHFLACEFTQ